MKTRICAASLILVLLVALVPHAALAAYSTSHDKAVAYMEITFDCGCTRIGTGAMVCVNGLITAAHNLYCSTHHKKATSFVFYFGYANKSNYFYKYNGSTTYWAFDTFTNGYSSANDIGYIRFDSNVGNTTGWFATRYEPCSNHDGKTCYIAAYDTGSTLTTYTGTLRYESGQQFSFNWPELAYGGEGGPIYVLRNGTETIIGVYTSHSDTRCFGRCLSKDVFDSMVQNLSFDSVTRD